jgi:hypothetical protein
LPIVCWAARPQDHSRERPADRERGRLDAGQPQRRQQRHEHREEADQEPDRPGRPRIHVALQQRPEGTAQADGEGPAQDHERHDRRRAHGEVRSEDAVAVRVRDDDRGDQRREQRHVRARPRSLVHRAGAHVPRARLKVVPRHSMTVPCGAPG